MDETEGAPFQWRLLRELLFTTGASTCWTLFDMKQRFNPLNSSAKRCPRGAFYDNDFPNTSLLFPLRDTFKLQGILHSQDTNYFSSPLPMMDELKNHDCGALNQENAQRLADNFFFPGSLCYELAAWFFALNKLQSTVKHCILHQRIRNTRTETLIWTIFTIYRLFFLARTEQKNYATTDEDDCGRDDDRNAKNISHSNWQRTLRGHG